MAHDVQTAPQIAEQTSEQVVPIEANTAAINALAEAILVLVSAIKESVLPFDVEFVDCLTGDCGDDDRSEAGTRVTSASSDASSDATTTPDAASSEGRVSLPVVPAQSRREPEPGGCGGPTPEGGCCQEQAAAGEGRHRKPEVEPAEVTAR